MSLFVLRGGKICHFLDAKRPVKKEREKGGEIRWEKREEDIEISIRSCAKSDSSRPIKSDRNQKRNLSVGGQLANLFSSAALKINSLVCHRYVASRSIREMEKMGRVQLYLSRELKVYENVWIEFFFFLFHATRIKKDRKGEFRGGNCHSKYSAVSISNKFCRVVDAETAKVFQKFYRKKQRIRNIWVASFERFCESFFHNSAM